MSAIVPTRSEEASPVKSCAVANHELVRSFGRYMTACGRSGRTIRAYLDSASRLVAMLGADSLAVVDRARLRAYAGSLYKTGLTANSVRLHLAGVRAFFQFIQRAGLTKNDPTLGFSSPKIPVRKPRVLSISEIERLIVATKGPYELAVVETLYGTGVRSSELVKIQTGDIDFAKRTIRVRKGKGGKDRIVLFGKHAETALRAYLASRPSKASRYVFEQRRRPDGWKKFPGAAWVRTVVGQIGGRAGLGRVYPHALRCAMASHMLQAGCDLRVIQELLGHEFLSTTQLYTFLSASDLKKIHAQCHPHEQKGAANV